MNHRIKLLVLDIDGTMTDGKIYMGPEGEICKAFHVRDGYGLHDLLPSASIEPVVITGRSSRIVQKRCEELGISSVHQGVTDKAFVLRELLEKKHLSYAQAAYMGDDLNDIHCMENVKQGGGFVGCPADAVLPVKELADYICSANGGDGAVREFIDWMFLMMERRTL